MGVPAPSVLRSWPEKGCIKSFLALSCLVGSALFSFFFKNYYFSPVLVPGLVLSLLNALTHIVSSVSPPMRFVLAVDSSTSCSLLGWLTCCSWPCCECLLNNKWERLRSAPHQLLTLYRDTIKPNHTQHFLMFLSCLIWPACVLYAMWDDIWKLTSCLSFLGCSDAVMMRGMYMKGKFNQSLASFTIISDRSAWLHVCCFSHMILWLLCETTRPSASLRALYKLIIAVINTTSSHACFTGLSLGNYFWQNKTSCFFHLFSSVQQQEMENNTGNRTQWRCDLILMIPCRIFVAYLAFFCTFRSTIAFLFSRI